MSTFRFISTAPFLGLVLTGLLAVRADFAAASLNVSDWQLTTAVLDNSALSTVRDFEILTTISNPFQAAANTAVGPNTATTAYDFAWSGDSGSFDIDMALNVETFRVDALSTGIILISPTTDLLMTIDASLVYASVPGDLAFIGFNMKVLDATTFAAFFRENRRGGNLTLDPAVGTLSINGDVILPAGTTYRIDFRASNRNGSDPNPTGPITSSGFIHFDFQPIPEPATAWLIAIGAVALHRPRRGRRCRRS